MNGWLLVTGLLAASPAWAQQPATAPYLGYHRYRGTVGGEAVTVELTVKAQTEEPAGIMAKGSCRFDSSATRPRELLSWRPQFPHQSLQLVEADTGRLGWRTGFWQAKQPAGPVLAGTWTGASGRQLPFELREDYRDKRGQLAAIPYELVRASLLKVDSCIVEPAEWETRGGEPSAMFDRQFLHFLGPDTIQGSIAALQCPPLAARQQQLWQEMQEEFNLDSIGRYRYPAPSYERPLTRERSYSLEVLYQGNGLLSWGEYSYFYHGGAHGGHSQNLFVYDLTEGAFLELTEQLRPGAEQVLCRLLTHHLRADEQAGGLSFNEDLALSNLPAAGFALVEKGLLFQYGDYEISGYVAPNPVVIPYAEVVPLLRPGTPVARMLRERGLWRESKK